MGRPGRLGFVAALLFQRCFKRFWSNALAVYARVQGPRMTNLGNAQEIFSRPAPVCEHRV